VSNTAPTASSTGLNANAFAVNVTIHATRLISGGNIGIIAMRMSVIDNASSLIAETSSGFASSSMLGANAINTSPKIWPATSSSGANATTTSPIAFVTASSPGPIAVNPADSDSRSEPNGPAMLVSSGNTRSSDALIMSDIGPISFVSNGCSPVFTNPVRSCTIFRCSASSAPPAPINAVSIEPFNASTSPRKLSSFVAATSDA